MGQRASDAPQGSDPSTPPVSPVRAADPIAQQMAALLRQMAVTPSVDDEMILEEEKEVAGDQGVASSRCGKRVKRGFDTDALDNAVMVSKPEHALGALFIFISICTGLPMHDMFDTHTVSPHWITFPVCTHVSVEGYNKVGQLFEAMRLKLAVTRLSDEHISRAGLAPRGRGGDNCGGRASRSIGRNHRSIVIREVDVESEDSEGMAS
ncbi:hypothetical protein JCGZ_05930 [Jatropha curcas]|uniref:Uncharacterized protein n=1 Tax=Jatropha curcas TaxID=180498 RepID=A0A067KML8_JATCU|nr:hypothetical protein JCGZ_05930 [Jatropha curcas]